MTTRAQIGFWLGGLLVFGVLLFLLRDMLLPFVAGMAVAYGLDPVADRLEDAGLSRTMATVVITILFVIVTVGTLFLLLPVIYQQLIDLISRVPAIADSIREYLLTLSETLFASLEPDQLERAREALAGFTDNLAAWAMGLGTGIWRSGLALINFVGLLFITPIVTFYLLRDWDHIVTRVDTLLPRRHAPEIRVQLGKINDTLAGFVRGQGLICLILMTYYGIGLTLVGLDFGLVVGLMAGALSFIPYVGAITGFVTAVTLALLQFDDLLWVGVVAVIFGIGQVVEGNILSPKLVGERVGLHPVWIIFGALAGVALFGFVGMLLAVPATAVIGVLVRFAAERYQASPVYLGHDGGVDEDGGPPS
ncbi:MAG: AI-2E family transporter [Alphaproteobacteria bacterium]